MSEESKMGLFGSKEDKTEPPSDENTKQNSPDSYAPYCIDSDSETYDTEALSIMDINDIIGVQSGQATESTLESEIAALTEIITDSKGDTMCDTMNDIHTESSDIKFNEELLTEFTSLSPSENPTPTTSKDFYEDSMNVDTRAENLDNIPEDKYIPEDRSEKEDSSSKVTSEVTSDAKTLDKVATQDIDATSHLLEQNNELGVESAEPLSETRAEKESSLSCTEKSLDDIPRNNEGLVTEVDKLPVNVDAATSEITSSEKETLTQVATELSENASAPVEMDLDVERKEDNKDLSKHSAEASPENACGNNANVSQDVDSALDSESQEKEAGDKDLEDEKSRDVLTNLGSTSKSLQLIGEAYISEDSQETDEKDESPTDKDSSVPLESVENKQTVEKNDEPPQKGSFDNVASDSQIDEQKINIIAGISENVVEKCPLENQDRTSSEDNNDPDNTKEILRDQTDNHENSRQTPSADSEINVDDKIDQVINEDKSVDSSLSDEKYTDKSNKFEVIPQSTVSIIPDTSTASATLVMQELVEVQEKPSPKLEQLEDIPLNSAAEEIEKTTEDAEIMSETNKNSEEMPEKTLDRAEALHEEMETSEADVNPLNTDPQTALEVDNPSPADLEPLEESKASPNIVSKDELENTTDMDTEIQPEDTKVTKSAESSVPVHEQDNSVPVESNIDRELPDSQSNEESASNSQHTTVEDKFAERDSESSMLPVEVDTNSEDKDNDYATSATSDRQTIFREEPSKEISDSVEQLLETTQGNTEDINTDTTNTEMDTPLATEVTDNKNSEAKEEDSCVRKMMLSIRKAEQEKDSEPNRVNIDSPILGGTPLESISDMPTNEEDSAIEERKEEVDEAENLETELNQSESVSAMENNEAISNFTETNRLEETIEECLNLESGNSTKIESVELVTAKLSADQITLEGNSNSLNDTLESENLGSITTENVPGSTMKTALENITAANAEPRSPETAKPDSSEDEAEIIQKPIESQEVVEPERVQSGTQVEPEISTTDSKDVSTLQARDQTQQLEECQSISELSVDTEEKLAKETSDNHNAEIEESISITEPSIKMIAENTTIIAELEFASEVVTAQGPLEHGRDSESKLEQEKLQLLEHEGNIDVLDKQPELDIPSKSATKNDQVQSQKPSQSNDEFILSDVKQTTKSEMLADVTLDEEQDDSNNQLKISNDKADSQLILEKSSSAVPCDDLGENLIETENKASENLSKNQVAETCGSKIGEKDSQGIQSASIVPADVTKSSEEEERLQEVKVLSTKPIDDEDLDETTNIPLSEENLELSQTLSGTNEIENDSEGTLLNLINETAPLLLQNDDLIESEVKIDEVLQCEPIEVLEKLAVVADEILIDELANSVLKDAEEPLENINNLEILPDSNLSMSTIVSSERLESTTVVTNLSPEIKDQPVSILDDINETCFIENLNQTPRISHGANYITDVIISQTNIDSIQLTDNTRDMDAENVTADEFEQSNQAELVRTSENLTLKDTTSIDHSIRNMSEACKLEIEENLVLDKNIEIDLPLKQEEAKLIECAVLRACDAKIDELADEVLFDAENAEQADALCSEPADADTSQQSSEFSELECAVKFLQESEEQTIDSPLLLSPKMPEEIVEENSEQSKSCLFLSETEVCRVPLELPAELEEITPDSIAISEAEIISEAAKLENERKLKIAAEMSQTSLTIEKLDVAEKIPSENSSDLVKGLLTTSEAPSWQEKKSEEENIASTSKKCEVTQMPKLGGNIIQRSDKIPKISILEERLKEPPKIEIPLPEGSPKISDTPTTPKTSLLIQRDSRMYQKMLESPKGGDKSEPKISDTPRKDSDKHDFENVGSPRIILKIAKSAFADCGEPRSPKSPKIRSAANSPNPEDSPGQKLGKIKLKLSKGGHPSIISNENFDETAPRHTEAIVSPSHIGMKIKLSKTGDASIIQPEKHDSVDEPRESKHKFEEASPKRIESPLGMKIKLSKTGDPSIVQQESKESTSKRKDKLDIGQEIPKRTDSPIGMKIKLSKSGDASIIQPEKQETSEDATYKDKFEIGTDIPKRTESPIGMKIKLSKTGDASIISSESCEDSSSKSRDKSANTQDIPKRTDSPLGMKFKLSKSGGASIIQPEKPESSDDFKDKSENIADITKRVESPIGMKIKLLKTGDASIIHPDKQECEDHRESITTKHRDKSETQEIQKRTDSPLGMRIKVTKTGEASVVPPEEFKESSSLNTDNFDVIHEAQKRNESPIGMKIKLSKSGDASIIHPEKQESPDEFKDSRGSSSAHQEGSKSSESLGMKIKLSKTGDASIIHPEISPESKDAHSKRTEKLQSSGEGSKRTDSPLGMKIKLSKTGDASIIEPDKKEKLTTKQKEKLTNVSEASPKRKEMEYPLEMKIKLSKTGHPTIIANEKQESHAEIHSKSKEYSESSQSAHHKRTGSMSPTKDSQLRIFKTGHSTIIQSNRSEVTIEPIQMLPNKPESSSDTSTKCKEVTISPIELKKSKLEAKLSHILPEVTIQPVMSGEQKQIMLDKKSSTISRQQMSVINQEISITQVSPSKPADLSMSGKLKEILRKNATNSPGNSDCEIIEHRPELIIVNENSNSSQDIMIIEEVKAPLLEVKIPRKRGRPRRSALPPGQPIMRQIIPQDPLALDNMQPSASAEHKESDRPKRTCRSQKSYAPPKRGRGRGRGKRKMDRLDCAISKIPRLHEDPLTAIERSTMSLIAPLQPMIIPEPIPQTSELYKALKQSPAERKRLIAEAAGKHGFPDAHKKLRLEPEPGTQLASDLPAAPIIEEHSTIATTIVATSATKPATISEMLHLAQPATVQQSPEKLFEAPKPEVQEVKNVITEITTTEHQNWLTPSIKLPEATGKTEAISMVQVMDEETRMSAESNSRSQTPARNISIPVVETVINEESQGSVLSTATTESEKVKVKNRRMEINFDPDEGPFTVDKIAEYEWPPDRKGDTFMIQEQISQYLGVKSFKRKYPDLKRRMVEMEERNFLRENCLVSEAMCDMGLTAICSTEVLDIMCSDFPDQYEEYRKHMREKQAKEHSKKQKELTAAANAERNRIDLAEMAVQSALSWNVNFNKARKESRKYSLDLQSFTIHVPKKQLKVDQAERKSSNYPVALIPGQYTDYYREYTPAELRYYPLNTVLYGPMRPNERKFDSQSEGSQSDSDSDSSSDDSSSSSSEGTQDTEESQSTVDEVDMEIASHKEDNKNLKCKMCLKHLNKHGKAEVLIQCGTCNGNVHPSCIDLTLDMVPHIQGYSWQCTDCKTCDQCHNPADEDKMLFCDMCDRGYHIYCVGLRRVPQGRWHCRECAVCASCGLRQPGGANSDRNSVAQWQHEYKKGERNTRVYVSTLCVPCSKLWRKGRYCPHCSRCHNAQRLDLEPNLVHCSACDKYLHLGCVENRSGTLDRKNYICECCSTPGQQLSRLLMSKNFKT